MSNSLNSTSLVIGPTSTVLLESLYANVNYIVFEPSTEGLDFLNYPIVSPFDGDDNDILVAKNQEELKKLIHEKSCVSEDALNGYFTSKFDFSEVFQKLI